MSIHSSLRGADSLKGERSVLKRMERILQLQREKKFDVENDSVYGLPKVRTKFKVAGKKKKKDDKEDEDQAAEPSVSKEAS